jgi:putative cell wall binding repeat protein
VAPALGVSVPSVHGHSRRLVALALALGVALCGCGKSLPGTSTTEANPTVIAPVNAQGAGGLATKNTTRLGGADVATDAAAVSLAVYPGLTAASRPQAVVVVDESEWPTALAAATLAGAPLNAPLLYSDKGALPEVSAQALRAMRPKGAAALGGAQVIAVGAPAAAAVPSGYVVHRVTGANPYALAAAVARLLQDAQGKPPADVVVSAADGPAALAMPAAGLAAQSGVPLLLVSTNGVPGATSEELKRWHRPAMYVVGSTVAVSSTTLMQLAHYGPAKRIVSPTGRIAPEDPAGNAIAVALFSEGGFGWGADEPGRGLVFAQPTRPLDAPAAAILSASGEYAPLLLLEGPQGVPAVLAEYLKDIQPGYSEPQYRPAHGSYNHGWLIGDESAISATTQAELDGMLEIAPSGTTSTSTSSASTTTGTATTTSSTATTTTTPTSTVKSTPTTSLPLTKK